MHHFALHLKFICHFANHKYFSYGNTISRIHLLRPSQVAKAVYYDSALFRDSRFCGDAPVKCIDICHIRENRKNFRLHTISINHGAAYQSLIPFAVKAERTDSIPLHPVILFTKRDGERLRVERNVQEGTKILAS